MTKTCQFQESDSRFSFLFFPPFSRSWINSHDDCPLTYHSFAAGFRRRVTSRSLDPVPCVHRYSNHVMFERSFFRLGCQPWYTRTRFPRVSHLSRYTVIQSLSLSLSFSLFRYTNVCSTTNGDYAIDSIRLETQTRHAEAGGIAFRTVDGGTENRQRSLGRGVRRSSAITWPAHAEIGGSTCIRDNARCRTGSPIG